MSKIVYKKYQEGFEKYQAQIYNSVAKKYNGQIVTEERIKKRLQDHKPTQDKEGITFAFENDKPISYIQYREYTQGKVRIGFPWAIDGTPLEVQDKLFYDLLNYLKKKYPEKNEFFLGNLNHVYTGLHDKIINHYGFTVDSWFAFYTISLDKLMNTALPNEYSFKEVYKGSMDVISEICLKDDSLKEIGQESIRDFFNTRVFTDDQTSDPTVTILYKKDQPIAVIAVTKTTQSDKDYSTVRIVGITKGEEKSYEYLLNSLASTLKSKNILLDLSVFVDNTVPYQEEILKTKGGIFLSKAYEYKLVINNR